jgi:acetyl esterase/lipase
MDHEGHQIGRWLNENGIAGFICDYRHRGKGYGHPAPLNDAQRAIRTVRSRAAEFKLDPAKIGILGFSAGGPSTLAAHLTPAKRDRPPSRHRHPGSASSVIVILRPTFPSRLAANLLGENPPS